MIENRKSLVIAVILGVISSVIAGAVIVTSIASTKETMFAMFFILLIFMCLFGSIFWLYHQIEYDRKKYKDEVRPWYSWFWYPQRKWSETFYWRGISRVTLGVPFIIYFWVVFIIGYSIGVGLLLSMLSFLVVMFTIHDIFHWSEKIELHQEDSDQDNKRSTWFVVPLLLFVILAVVISLPYIEQPKGNFFSYTAGQEYIGVWSNSKISFTMKADYTLIATYNGKNYYGWWSHDIFSAKITWGQPLQLPHPNDPSQLYTIEEVYLINNGRSISLYTAFDTPAYLTLDKVS